VPFLSILLQALHKKEDITSGIDMIIFGLGGAVFFGFAISYLAFYLLTKIADKDTKRFLLKMGNLGLAFYIIGQFSFAMFYLFIARESHSNTWADHLLMMLLMGAMVYYVLYCNNEQRDLDL
jgi:hypothetical protein